jgi:hypothetical protein
VKNRLLLLAVSLVAGTAPLGVPADDRAAPEPSTPPAIRLLSPPEHEFFSKVLDCDGIPIKAHQDVSDEALREGFRRLSLMLAHQPDVRANLVRAGAELHIIGKDQVTSDLPEHRHLKGKPFEGRQTVDQRTRGLGGLLTSCGEENLLRLREDRYRGRDICVHEFAHNIFQHGISSRVRKRFEEQRRQSLERGRWKGSYAGSNAHEFFAELSMWYWGTRGDLGMAGPKPKNGRAGLQEYDPEAFALLDDFYQGRLRLTAPQSKLPPERPSIAKVVGRQLAAGSAWRAGDAPVSVCRSTRP